MTNMNKNSRAEIYLAIDHSSILTVVQVAPLLEQELELAAVVASFKTKKQKNEAID